MDNETRKTDEHFKLLGQECLEHLASEEESLRGFLEHALAVQESVINGAQPQDAHLQQKQDQLAIEAESLSLSRRALQEKIARHFNKPVDLVSIKALAEELDEGLANRIMGSRQRILDLTRSIEDANRKNYLLIQQTMDLMQRLHLAITGQSPAAQTYSPKGQLNRRNDNALLETEC